MRTDINEVAETMRNSDYPTASQKLQEDWKEWAGKEAESHQRGKEPHESFYDREREENETRRIAERQRIEEALRILEDS